MSQHYNNLNLHNNQHFNQGEVGGAYKNHQQQYMNKQAGRRGSTGTRRDSLSIIKEIKKERNESDNMDLSKTVHNDPDRCDLFGSINYQDIDNTKYLAGGAFSHVIEGTYNGQPIVAKLLQSKFKDSPVTFRQMQYEQELLSRLKHPNIVNFIGSGEMEEKGELFDVGTPFTVLERLYDTLTQYMKRKN
jgi:serine/threonine protein kinase